MVTGVNSGYYGYYNYPQQQQQQQVQQYGNYQSQQLQQQPSFTGLKEQSAAVKTSADGCDDGKLSIASILGNIGKGAVKFVTGMFTDESGNFSLGQTLKSALIAAGVGAVCVLTAGTAVPAILAATGIGVSGLGVAKAGLNAALADSDAEAEQAWQNLGSNGLALGLSIYGAKSIAKSNAANAKEATKYDGILKGSWESVKHVFKKSAEPFQNSFKGVGNAYKGASLTEKVTNAAKHVKDNAIAEGKAFGKQVHKNANDILFGSKTTVADKKTKLSEEKENLQKQVNDPKIDKKSIEYKKAQTRLKTIEAEQKAIAEMENITSWEEGYRQVKSAKDELSQLEKSLGGLKGAAKAKVEAKIENLKVQIEAKEQILSVKSSEAAAIRDMESRLVKLQEKPTENAKSIERLTGEIAEAKSRAGEFKLPDIVSKSDINKLAKVMKDNKARWAKVNEDTPNIIRDGILDDIAESAGKYASAKAKYDIQASTNLQSKGFFNNVRSTLQSKVINAYKTDNTVRVLGAGITGTQFITTPEAYFYEQLSAEEQAVYKKLPFEQKAQLAQVYRQAIQ